MPRQSLIMIAFCTIAFASCGAPPATNSDTPTECPVSVPVATNAKFEAGFQPLATESAPSVVLTISNTGGCAQRGTNCTPPAVIGGIYMGVELKALDANGQAITPTVGTYQVTATHPDTPGALSAYVGYATTTTQEFNPKPIALTSGTLVVESIAWTEVTAPYLPRLTAISGRVTLTLPDNSVFMQTFNEIDNCEP